MDLLLGEANLGDGIDLLNSAPIIRQWVVVARNKNAKSGRSRSQSGSEICPTASAGWCLP